MRWPKKRQYDLYTTQVDQVQAHLLSLGTEVDLLFADCRPELDRLEGHRLVLMSHSHNRQTEQCSLHVELHLVVVQRHDSDQTLESAHLNGGGLALSRLADDLHNVVSLTLARQL